MQDKPFFHDELRVFVCQSISKFDRKARDASQAWLLLALVVCYELICVCVYLMRKHVRR